MKSRLNHWFMLTCMAVLFVSGINPVDAGVPDAWISTKVKMLLLNSPEVSGLPINVDTDAGRVTLHGMVSTTDERTEATRIATAGTGVVSVRNLLQVVPKSRRKAVNINDEALKVQVSASLKSEPMLSNSSIGIKSVNKGVVLLDGKAASLSDHLLALEATSSVPGVRQVASEIESPDVFGDREIWFDAAPNNPARGNVFTDGWITAQTKLHFMTDADIPASDINVDTHRGVVTLFGTTPNSAVSLKAAQVARAVPGVKSVRSELRVVAPSKKALALAKDDEIEAAVRQRVADAAMAGAEIKVEVKASTARLTGTVQQASQRYSAVAIAYSTPGVSRVVNDIRFAEPTTSQ